MDTVRELSKPGQALAPNAATATTNNPAWWVGGQPTLTRDLLHERLIDEARAAAPDVEQQRRAIVLAGPPGAGKSTVLAGVLGEHRGKYLVIDADEFKRLLLREAVADGSYDEWLVPDAIRESEAQGERFYPLEMASLVHEESSYLGLRGEGRKWEKRAGGEGNGERRSAGSRMRQVLSERMNAMLEGRRAMFETYSRWFHATDLEGATPHSESQDSAVHQLPSDGSLPVARAAISARRGDRGLY